MRFSPGMLTIRRPIPALSLWPGDAVRTREDGTLELVRVLPEGAGEILRQAELIGDVKSEPLRVIP